jgi:VTC domain
VADVEDLFSGLRPVSLDEVNERAALQRRTDNKYLVPLDDLAGLLEGCADEHDVLEIDGTRVFDYESTYFDTPSLRCFHDHIDDRTPRFKARTRCYVTTGECFFEVKVKRDDGETLKRNVEYDPEDRNTITPAARELLAEVLTECGLDQDEEELAPSLITSFRRVTVVARERPERTTFDFDVSLSRPDRAAARLGDRYLIAETKTPDGSGAWDRAFEDAGNEPVSLSKYRVGTGLLHAPDEDAEYAGDLKELFEVDEESGRGAKAADAR